MIKNTLGKRIGICALVLILCCVGTTAFAATSDFSLKVTKTGYDQDAISKRTLKAGGEKWENCFYATPSLFNPSGAIQLKSIKLNEESICTSWVTARSTDIKTVSAYYNQSAPAEKYYYMKGAYVSSGNGYSLTVVGKYTP